jgi:hypothetical protein
MTIVFACSGGSRPGGVELPLDHGQRLVGLALLGVRRRT